MVKDILFLVYWGLEVYLSVRSQYLCDLYLHRYVKVHYIVKYFKHLCNRPRTRRYVYDEEKNKFFLKEGKIQMGKANLHMNKCINCHRKICIKYKII